MSSIVLFGPPGGGKTTLAASMHKLGYIPRFIDLDRKVRTMLNLQPLLKEGKIQVIDFKSKLTEASFSKRVKLGPDTGPLQQPQGYLELADIITELEEDPSEDHLRVVPVLDSLTRVIEHMKRWIFHIQKRNTISMPDWGTILTNLEELLDAMVNLQVPLGDEPARYPHVILIAHDKLEKDEFTGQVLIKPLIDGAMRDKIGSVVDEMYYCTVEVDKQGEAEYLVTTKPVGKINQARTSREIDTYMPADFSELFKGEEYEEPESISKKGGGKKDAKGRNAKSRTK